MARGIAHVLEIVVLAAGPHAALRGHGPPIRPLVRAEEHVLELDHPRVGEEERRVVARHEQAARHDLVPPRPEVIQKGSAKLVACVHSGSPSPSLSGSFPSIARRTCRRVNPGPRGNGLGGRPRLGPWPYHAEALRARRTGPLLPLLGVRIEKPLDGRSLDPPRLQVPPDAKRPASPPDLRADERFGEAHVTDEPARGEILHRALGLGAIVPRPHELRISSARECSRRASRSSARRPTPPLRGRESTARRQERVIARGPRQGGRVGRSPTTGREYATRPSSTARRQAPAPRKECAAAALPSESGSGEESGSRSPCGSASSSPSGAGPRHYSRGIRRRGLPPRSTTA